MNPELIELYVIATQLYEACLRVVFDVSSPGHHCMELVNAVMESHDATTQAGSEADQDIRADDTK